ncbi:MAG TPA: glycerate kinase [Lacunisphaera sp.]|nr:glycerate kinase [Lacunisphaera sp.]
MRALVAFDKFKDALSARQACDAAAAAIHARHPDWIVDVCPLTDGGEGFAHTLTTAARGRIERVTVAGPRGGPVGASLGLVETKNLSAAARRRLPGDGTIALIDLASASGLGLLPPGERDPWQATTLGTGELMRQAARHSPGAILLGVGGSATNDLGLGALAALGFCFLDAAGVPVTTPTPATWERIARIDVAGRVPLPPVFIACDVTNPLLGPRGATATFGPQKGLVAADLPRLEAQAARMAGLLGAACGQPRALAETPGAGAAGGIPFGLMAACGAKILPGFELVAEWLDLPARIAAAEVVITGEGRFDATSLDGKGPGSLFAEARRLGKRALVFAGSLGVPPGDGLHAITPAGLPLAAALPRTAELLTREISRAL